MVTLKVARTDPHVRLPEYQSEGAAGMDLRACLAENLLIPPQGRARIPTGLRIELPDGFEAQIRPRSGLADKFGVTVLNAPGTIDPDYRGDINIILVNHGTETYIVRNGDRIAQLVIAPIIRAALMEITELSETARGVGGFGSTGV